MTATTTTTTAGERLRAMREAAGYSLADAYADLRASGLPRRFIKSQATLQRMESGHVAEPSWNGVLVVALAELFGCGVADISPAVSEECDAVADLLIRRSGWFDQTADLAATGTDG